MKYTATAQENYSEFVRCYTARHEAYVRQVEERRKFYNSEQWTEEELAGLGDRPALTINLARRAINTVLGHYARNVVDPRAKAARRVSGPQAEVMTAVLKNIANANNYPALEIDMIRDGLIDDRGFIDCRIEFDTNAFGDVTLRRLDSMDVLLDPEAKDYDPSTWTQVIVIEWYSPDDLDEMYGPGTADSIGASIDSSGGLYGSEYVRFGDTEVSSRAHGGSGAPDPERIRAIRTISRQYYKLCKVFELVDPETGDVHPLPANMTEREVRKLSKAHGMLYRKMPRRRVWWTVSAGDVVLFDDWSPYESCFTVVPFFPYFVPGNPSGLMRDLMSPQEQLNKIESQILHVINTTANSGYVVEAGSLVNMTVEELEQRGAETGLVVEYARGRQPPAKIQPNVAPSGLENFAAKARGYMATIPGIEGLMGPEPATDVDGVVLERSQTLTEQGLGVITANLKKTRRCLFNVIAKMVQRYYTVPRMLRVQDALDPEQLAVDVQINTSALNTLGLFKYDVVVGTVPSRDTLDETQFAQALQMRKVGVTIPDYHVILASNLLGKDRIAHESKQLQGLGEKTPEQEQIEQLTLQLTLRKAAADVAEVEAKVAKLQAEAQQTAIEAQFDPHERQTRMQMDMAELQASLENSRAQILLRAQELQNRVTIANIHANARQNLTRYSTLMKNAQKEQDQAVQLQLELAQAALNRRGQDLNLVNNREERALRATIEGARLNVNAERNDGR